MRKVNIRELKAHLSEFIERVENGESLIVAKRNEPVAEIHPIPQRKHVSIFAAPVKGLHVTKAFFEPLPDDVAAAFLGETDS
ncbi:MAG: type II toxin-antitoxin system Phd/YefM family antitoxin [Candidatus Eremiobacteraeota bacterium]|nr:type II toxin-antitoxin system Phd/YefM family antitoxin [Candidatus Eremiobacteraeota bacterium]